MRAGSDAWWQPAIKPSRALASRALKNCARRLKPGCAVRKSNRNTFAHQIAFNLIPHIDPFGPDGYTGEEKKLINEVRKILELPNLAISPTTVRVPVFTAHSIAINAETELPVSPDRAREVFRQFPGLQVWDTPEENRYPMPATVEGQDDCVVGRIRQDLSHPNALNLWVVGDQLRKGAALNGLQIAECLLSQS